MIASSTSFSSTFISISVSLLFFRLSFLGSDSGYKSNLKVMVLSSHSSFWSKSYGSHINFISGFSSINLCNQLLIIFSKVQILTYSGFN